MVVTENPARIEAAARKLPDILISTDDHLIEPPDVWQSRLPERLKSLGPQSRRDGAGRNLGNQRRAAAQRCGNRGGREPHRRQSLFHARRALFGNHARGHMMRARVSRTWIPMASRRRFFSTTCPGFAGALFLELSAKNEELAMACVRAYNELACTGLLRCRFRTSHSAMYPAIVGFEDSRQGDRARGRPRSSRCAVSRRSGLDGTAAF